MTDNRREGRLPQYSPAAASGVAGPALLSAPKPTAEQEEIITDALFRERIVDVSPWVEIPSRVMPMLLTLFLFFRYVSWHWIAAWEFLWLLVIGVVMIMRRTYRANYPPPRRPANAARWRKIRIALQSYGWLVTGLIPLFCFWVGSTMWEIAGVAGGLMILVYSPYDAVERAEVLAAGIFMPLPLLVILLARGTPLHIALAVLTVGVTVMLIVWGVRQIGSARKEVFMRVILREERDRAEQANVAKSKFLAAASHDLRQPLHALGLFAAALNERVQGPEAHALVRNINRSVQALEGLFNALLDISKLDAGVVEPIVQHFNLDALFLHLRTEYLPQARARGLAFECSGSGLVVQSDPLLLETILRNLISNAIRYTRAGEVRVSCQRQGEHVVIEVSDTGIGIAEEHQNDIFREFYQLHNPERDRTKGLGLGLAIVHRTAKLLGHGLALKSAPDRGSLFRLTLPAGDAAAVQVDEVTSETPRRHAGRLNVLVIDDEATVCEAMRILLENWGYQVMTAGSIDDALAQLTAAPDVIIADYRLREDRTGAEAIRAIQQRFDLDIPALIVTGDTDPERITQAKQSGFAFLHKPVAPGKLRAFLRGAAAPPLRAEG